MKKTCIFLLSCVSFVALSVESHSMWTVEGHRKYIAKMTKSFNEAIKPTKDSMFVGSWQNGKGYSLNFKADGSMSIIFESGKAIQGLWAMHKDSTKERPKAIYRIKYTKEEDFRFATVDRLDNKVLGDGDIIVSYGDLYRSNLKKAPNK